MQCRDKGLTRTDLEAVRLSAYRCTDVRMYCVAFGRQQQLTREPGACLMIKKAALTADDE